MPTTSPEELRLQEEREELRYAVRRFLYARPTAAVSADTILHGLRAKGLSPTLEQVNHALSFWMHTTPAQVMGHRRQHSALLNYQISADGIVAEESGN